MMAPLGVQFFCSCKTKQYQWVLAQMILTKPCRLVDIVLVGQTRCWLCFTLITTRTELPSCEAIDVIKVNVGNIVKPGVGSVGGVDGVGSVGGVGGSGETAVGKSGGGNVGGDVGGVKNVEESERVEEGE